MTNDSKRRNTFDKLSQAYNRFDNAAHEMGFARGDRVMVLLGKVPE